MLSMHATGGTIASVTIERELINGSLRQDLSPEGTVLLMTATLQPPANAVARADPAARLADYAAALTFYLNLPSTTVDRIIFADNSASGIAAIRQIVTSFPHDKTVEIMSFAGNDHAVSHGKAYGEFKLIDIALANASIIEPTDMVWKVTGRLKVLNLQSLHRLIARVRPDIACDLHNVPWIGTGRWRGNQRMDLRVFAFRPAAFAIAYQGVWSRLAPFDDTSMYHVTMAVQSQLRVMPRFPIQPILDGVSGRHQRNYAAFGQKLKTLARSLMRVLLPFVWL